MASRAAMCVRIYMARAARPWGGPQVKIALQRRVKSVPRPSS